MMEIEGDVRGEDVREEEEINGVKEAKGAV